ncbi:BadF/BadG/BcrA/BcrD ATPase family protein [Chitinimonas sp. BJYL2]|uniref:BadF/BadG/BcrA/BcrD ATPase family protein n=1 Tax=Chitinimonas sp. BJYL2 TaxID=2976696 RepID=UPI0022B54DD2|nr:BadF/BadG/BcrA/BcrD ATPase family protein [Chitinimonas sp. BJYL2]
MTFDYLIGVDGGGTGTRVVVADRAGQLLARASGGPSGLGLGIAPAWQAISAAVDQAFANLGSAFAADRCAIGLGLAGVHNPIWAKAFLDAAPAYAAIALDTDGFTTLLGAHNGQPGAIVAVGTGTIGEAWYGGRDKRTVSGWGFPSGDEGSGAWIGLKAAQLAQKALDGRVQRGALASAVIERFGGNIDAAYGWLGQANQTTYAQLTPLVIQHGGSDADADAILTQAGQEIASVAHALDPHGALPLALCGGLAEALQAWLPEALRLRARQPQGDSATGALHLIRGRVHG